jgi:hypothetical protein
MNAKRAKAIRRLVKRLEITPVTSWREVKNTNGTEVRVHPDCVRGRYRLIKRAIKKEEVLKRA